MTDPGHAAETLTVLLIEDNPGDARLITVLLDGSPALGLRVDLQIAASLAEGIERLRAGDIDVVLLDLGLPESSGLETVERLFVSASRVPPLVVLSGLEDEGVAVQALQSGAQDYLVKGRVDSAALVRALRYAVGRHRAEEAMNRQLEQARELASERAIRRQAEGESESLRRLLDEREAMLRMLAHEVRQPLNNASAALENASQAIAGSDARLLPEVALPLERARQVLDHVIGTLNNALAAAMMLASGDLGSIGETDLDTLIGLVVRDIGQEQRARVSVEVSSELRTVQLQPALMRLALCNLLVNALAYSPSGSPVRLRISDSDDPPALCFEVADAGSGIPSALLPRLFEQGTRGPDARAGTGAGLGLYIVRRVVEHHHGRIDVMPNTPRGTIVRMNIPQGIEA